MAEFRDGEVVRDHAPHVDHNTDHAHGEHDHGAELAATLGNRRVGQVLGSGVQRDGATSAQQLDEAVARTIEQRRGGGQPLDDSTRTDMERSLGHDLSDVRVHTDSSAHDLNEAVSARAFTTGNDVFFKQGTYDPASSSGRELLGHELTHVVQQREGTSGLEAGQVSHPSDPAEQHAESVGRQLALAPSPTADTSAPAGAGTGLARQATPEEEDELQASRDPNVARQEAPEEEELQAAHEPGVARDEAPQDEEEVVM